MCQLQWMYGITNLYRNFRKQIFFKKGQEIWGNLKESPGKEVGMVLGM